MSSHIQIRGARENILRGIDLAIPKLAITIFTGVSGSGKSCSTRSRPKPSDSCR